MARYIRNTTILAKIETTYGTDSIPTGAANSMLVSNVTVAPVHENVSRDLIRSYMGASEQLVGTRYISLDFTVELQGSGTAGTIPAWGALMRACSFAEADLLTPDRIEYSPVSSAQEGVSIYYYLDGVLWKALGCRGTCDIDLTVGARPTMSFKFFGIDGGATAATPSGVSYTSFKTPVTVTAANSDDFLIGNVTYAAGVLSGGTASCTRGMNISLGNDYKHVPTLCGESVDITGREITGSMVIDLAAAAEVTEITAINANTTTAIGWTLGTVAGYKVMIYAPAVQRINPKYEDVDGRAMLSVDLRFLPSAGNDELKLIML